jgi:hypothetical protein
MAIKDMQETASAGGYAEPACRYPYKPYSIQDTSLENGL